jgi:hypothetical protein
MATISQQLTQLQIDKQTLVNNLVAKGVEATSKETFTSLVPKVADIQSGGVTEDLTEELTEQNNLLSTQEITIENIISALEDKCAGGGGITPKVEGNTLILSGANVEGGVLSI